VDNAYAIPRPVRVGGGIAMRRGQSDVHFAATEPGYGMTTFIVIWLFCGFIAAAITPATRLPPGPTIFSGPAQCGGL
jgi:hypothetical protein